MGLSNFIYIRCVAACAGVALLAQRGHSAENVSVTVLAILASDKHTEVNDRIKEIAKEIQKKEPKLTGFRLERTTVKSMAPGSSTTMKLVDKEKVEVLVNEKPDEEGRVTLTIKPPDMGEIVYACRCGKCFPIATNYYTAEPKHERLIIVIMAKPCFAKKEKE
jgi:hypothetical protein